MNDHEVDLIAEEYIYDFPPILKRHYKITFGQYYDIRQSASYDDTLTQLKQRRK